ncbi:MAG TPA: undecaprenyl-diphosphatase [Alphaproteobacteria bacterium]|nr:undecaprenyl-diphosphatase [Alphaproteobacteria bacterium]HAJ45899.1 undecaprenyl-diphosphatase [Alphaproteobacteria bacterium]
MDLFWQLFLAVLLGLVEGFTEFLPISSTGHLILLESMLCFEDKNHAFKVMIQFGAILAVVVIYFSHLLNIALAAPQNENARRFVIGIIIAFLPAAAIGALLGSYIKEVLFNPLVVATSLIVGGIAILVIERIIKIPQYYAVEDFPISLYIKIGLVQCIAFIPGVSRSGATIMGSLLMRVERGAATEFSFFLAIPTMLGAFSYDLYKNYKVFDTSDVMTIGIGFAVAFVTAYFVVSRAIAFVRANGFWPFAWYRIALGSLMLGAILYTQDIKLKDQCAPAPTAKPAPIVPAQ